MNFVLRTSDGLHAKLKKEAARRDVSMNSLINELLDNSLKMGRRSAAEQIKNLARFL